MSALRRIGVLTGGGDCPGLNAVIRAVVKTAIFEYGLEVVGVQDGFLGLIENRIEPLTLQDASNILTRGGTILGTSNKANPKRFKVGEDASGGPIFEDVTDRVLANVAQAGLDALVCIGGDGTMTCAQGIIERGVRCVGVPKTIDNDLMHTDVTFGFHTAVQTACEALDRIHTTASSHHRVMLVETMGRNAGWLALYSGAASGADVILIPEIPYDLDVVCNYCLGRNGKGKSFTIITVSEGAKPIGGEVVVDKVIPDSPDPIRLGGVSEVLADQISERTGLETRATILGHVQRGGSPVAYDRVLATRFGHKAMELLGGGEFNRMVVHERGQITSVPISEVANQQRLVPPDHPLLAAVRAIGVCMGNR
ncbi:MAG: ATP-dependent 6-phosphofructokinase [Planctomycetota bacterium]|nr:ATP-dependent 6-phosphofructokinase [Planctomycetota bacterium]